MKFLIILFLIFNYLPYLGYSNLFTTVDTRFSPVY